MAIKKTEKSKESVAQPAEQPASKFDTHLDTEAVKKEPVAAIAPIEAIAAEPKPTKKRGTATTRTTTKTKAGEAVEGVSETVLNPASPDLEPVVDQKVEEVAAVPAETKKRSSKKEATPQQDLGLEESEALPKHLDPNAIALVGATGARTINLGNYESAKIEVYLQLPTAVGDIDATYAYATAWVEKKLEDALGKPVEVASAKTVVKIHGSDTPVTKPASTGAGNTNQLSAATKKPASTPPAELPASTANGVDPAKDPEFEWHEDL
ncbi:MAG: hypothetical protein RR280_04245 [Bacteroidaceae bacterium]